MKEDGQPLLSRESQLRLEGVSLRFLRRMVVVVVETDLPDRDDLLRRRKLLEELQVLVLVELLRLVRMDSDGGEDARRDRSAMSTARRRSPWRVPGTRMRVTPASRARFTSSFTSAAFGARGAPFISPPSNTIVRCPCESA